MMKLLLLFNEFFLYLDALHRNLNFLKQTCTFLHLLTQLSSLSYVCFIRCGIFDFAAAFLFCLVFFILPWLFYFAVVFLFCRGFLVLQLLFYFAVAFLFCLDFLVLLLLFYFAVAFLFCRVFLVLPWLFYFAVAFFVLPWLFYFAGAFLFCRGYFAVNSCFAEAILSRRDFYFAVAFCFAVAFLFCRVFLVLPWIFGFAVTLTGHRKICLFQERKELSKGNKKHFSLFHKCPFLDKQNKLAKM